MAEIRAFWPWDSVKGGREGMEGGRDGGKKVGGRVRWWVEGREGRREG